MGSEARSAVAVSSWGKWKTATQMGSLTMLLVCRSPAGGAPQQLLDLCAAAGPPLLVVATYLTVHSLALYLRALWPYLSKP
jgi:CDP-diacylglycerol--glycerol-3-phosphate 3-phosphatidyltransferase